ncbi:zinc-binding metallopeptidase family protein [Larsenimonas rhizosphaerae]|uniref:Zinc-binding metallopeptidase n=1 Tax=Larsenimonas rhizosphaerae TaxID=2944682 RepID=A0AA41ZN19_9GAMM|nr:putative zinc-binding metallopeptidase [Larsenimonas rhizosphaerae]MCM2131354.1 putative zinc-binding peptidase [Larsenimonas rhizosphaerae]MCX2525281.1 putative zinc-binding metallopeptidase [Larsenimonas rhizosphaerae]
MRVFTNPVGAGSLWFDNLATADGVQVGYDPQARAFLPMPPFCANRELIGCNWIASEPGALCRSCAMSAMIPDLSIPDAVANWALTEAAKRWALDNLGRWYWFRPEDPGVRPVFHMLAEGETPVMMGHAAGVVTISVAEADVVLRTSRREALDEPYRTMIGHMRHEISHMLWWRLSIRDDFIKAFRKMFGDEREDYAAALKRHYNQGPPSDWQEHYLTAYASAHPHEDWAETTAHLLHLTDITDSFVAAGLSSPELPAPGWDPYAEPDTARLIHIAATLSVGVNHVNRAMGLSDLYPFVLSESAHRKLAFVHEWLRRGATSM